jgi:bifunctional DNA primase/polymerase-like protein
MKSAEEFLEHLKKAQAPAASQPRSSSIDSPEIEFDSTLTSALKRGWHIAPVLARSRYFPSKALAGHPTNDFVQISQCWEQYFESGCNWAVEMGARSDLLIMEFDCEVGRRMLPHLCGNNWSWRTTLQFTDQNARFVCFHYSGQPLRAIGRDFPGVRIHQRSCILIPPSTYSTGAQVSYLNPGSKVSDVPDWLLDVRRTNKGTANPPLNQDEDYFAA